MEKFTIWKNEYLREKTNGYYNTFYIGYKQEGNPDFLNDLKNTFGNTYRHVLLKAKNEVCDRLLQDLPKVVELENLNYDSDVVNGNSVEELIALLDSFNLNYDKSDYFCKKAWLLIEKERLNEV